MRLWRSLTTSYSSKLREPASVSGASPQEIETFALPSTIEQRQILSESNAHNAAGRYAAALSLIAGGLAENPNEPQLLFARASTLFHWDRFREALDPYLRAESLGLEHDMLFLQLGWTHFYLGNLGEAEGWMRRAITRRSDDSKAHYALGVVLRAQKRITEAVESYEQALRLSPDNINCLINLGVCKIDQGDPTAAERLLRRAIELNPNRAMAWDNLGVALHRQDRFSEAFAVFDRSEQLEIETGENVDSFVNFANALRDNGQIQDAIDRFEGNLAQRPNVYGHGQYALALLTAGRLREGWRQAEFRWIQEPLLSQRPSFAKPVWTGQDLRGKTILLRSEQGFGDTIQFIRYAPLVKALGATVLVQVRSGLEGVTARVAGIDRFVRPGDPIPEFDFHIHLLSLPGLFGTDIDSIPADVPYLSVEPGRASYWANRLPSRSELKVGLAWAGNPAHLQDRQRSIPLHVLAPLGTLEGVRFYSLQKGLPEERIDLRAPGLELEDLGSELHDFSDTAAAIGQLDLVICVDTAVGHLAGALGKPVWLLLPHSGDWRWLQGREDSPWYPTMRLFRQSQRGAWGEVVDRVRKALLLTLGGEIPVPQPSKRAVTAPARPSRLPECNAAVSGSRRRLERCCRDAIRDHAIHAGRRRRQSVNRRLRGVSTGRARPTGQTDAAGNDVDGGLRRDRHPFDPSIQGAGSSRASVSVRGAPANTQNAGAQSRCQSSD